MKIENDIIIICDDENYHIVYNDFSKCYTVIDKINKTYNVFHYNSLVWYNEGIKYDDTFQPKL